MTSIIEEFTKNMRQQIILDFQSSELFEHNLLKGENNESILIERLRKYLPKKYELIRGKVFSSENKKSDEIDIIIYDNFHNSELIGLKRASLVPVEITYAVISVKTTLTKEELIGSKKKRGCIDNINSVKELKKIRGLPLKWGSGTSYFDYQPTVGIIFAYNSDSTLKTISKNFVIGNNDKKIGRINQIDFICIFNKGIIINDRQKDSQNDRIMIIPRTDKEDEKYKTFLDFVVLLISHMNYMPMGTLDLKGYLKPEFYQNQLVSECKVKDILKTGLI